MFHSTLHQNVSRTTVFQWFLLSFLAGNVNAGGFLATARFVSHVTGFATFFGVELAHGNWRTAFGVLSVPAYFLMGVMISGILVDRPAQLGRKPHYAVVMGLVAFCLLTAAIAGHYQLFGAFGSTGGLRSDYFLLALLCAASGLQNAAITTASGSSVRVTHLTGLTTDLGLSVVRAFSWGVTCNEGKRELKHSLLRLGTIASFACGSACGAVLFIRYDYLGFLLPFLLAVYAMFIASDHTVYEVTTMPVKYLNEQIKKVKTGPS